MSDNTGVVFLVGFMGAGKTTVGRILARLLRWDFVDLHDPLVEIHEIPPQESRQDPADGGLARAHEADEEHDTRVVTHGSLEAPRIRRRRPLPPCAPTAGRENRCAGCRE